jgi:hypothetical protein
MDGDLQHDDALLPRMLDVLRGEVVDLVVGSRYVTGGGRPGRAPPSPANNLPDSDPDASRGRSAVTQLRKTCSCR